MNIAVATPTKTASASTIASVVTVMVMGFGLLTLAGHVQAAALHDAAHDVRHATGFPCH